MTVGEMLVRMSSAELVEWAAEFKVRGMESDVARQKQAQKRRRR